MQRNRTARAIPLTTGSYFGTAPKIKKASQFPEKLLWTFDQDRLWSELEVIVGS